MGHGRDAQQVVSELWFAALSDLPHQKRIILCVGELFVVVCVGYCCVATMVSFSSAVKFDIEKFDGRMVFDLWQVQVKDVLIQSGIHKVRKVRTAMEEDVLLAGPQLHMGICWRLMQVV
ncbi:hypothetical protein PIB30_011879 [Stylosanthes scabra]|uniref:Uncharacterized protein n=1 Tax=Stylosanthes scabra TaxID=79078 RepID=A0ABU6U5V8_9FABA|nr:hypothetical protein [Stylosanthes scabra]